MIVANNQVIEAGSIDVFKTAVFCECLDTAVTAHQATGLISENSRRLVLTEIYADRTGEVLGVIEEINRFIEIGATGVNAIAVSRSFDSTAISQAGDQPRGSG